MAEKLEGTRAQRKNWGLAYKTAEYKELDRLYNIYSSRYVDSGIDEMLEFDLRRLCKLQLAFDQTMGTDDPDSKKGKEIISMMKIVEASIKDRTQGSKNPTENQIDTVRAAMERAGMTRNGHIIPYKEMLELLQKDHPHYPMSHDGAAGWIAIPAYIRGTGTEDEREGAEDGGGGWAAAAETGETRWQKDENGTPGRTSG